MKPRTRVNEAGVLPRVKPAQAGLDCAVVIATRNRRARLAQTLERLLALPERPPVIVVDNGSTDGTPSMLLGSFSEVLSIALPENIGAAARTVGARAAQTRYVAFCDDDCWWSPESLPRAVEVLEATPGVALVNARILVGDSGRVDETSLRMRESPVPKRSACPGSAILAFMAGACVFRTSAFLGAGGYHRRYQIGAEESLLALDLAQSGWEMIYLDDVTLHHAPSDIGRDARLRRILVRRNRLWTAWLRWPALDAVRYTAAMVREAGRDSTVRAALVDALRGLPWVLLERRPVSPDVIRGLRMLEELPA